MTDEIKIICEFCGTTETRTDVKEGTKYFPNRMVYLDNQLMPHKCKFCGNDNGLSIFGKQFIYVMWKPEINRYPEVIENNLIYNAQKNKFSFMENTTPKILTETEADKIYDNCVAIYDLQGASAVYDYCNKLNLDYSYCNPCEADTPDIRTETAYYCAVCGSGKIKVTIDLVKN